MTESIEATTSGMAPSGPAMRFQCDYGLMEALGYIIIWIIISIITFGIGAFFAIYYFYKSVINKTYVLNRKGERVGRLNCDLGFAEIVGHVILWVILTIVTLGIAAFFYIFRTLRLCMNRTIVVSA